MFALPGVRLYHIWPVWLEGWDSVLLSALPVLSILGYSVPVLFYRGTLGESRGGFAMAAAVDGQGGCAGKTEEAQIIISKNIWQCKSNSVILSGMFRFAAAVAKSALSVLG